MDRRAFFGTLTGGLLAAPLAAEAQRAGNAGPEMWGKVLEFLKEIAPKISRVGVLMNSTIPLEARGFEVLRERARGRGLSLLPAECRAADEFPRAFDTMIRDNAADAVVASESPLNRYTCNGELK
jgi:ABC-type uncharacterized transport system substrate-binding protein